jgi:hypothetical protein
MSADPMTKHKPKQKPGPKPDPSRVRTALVQIRAMPAWKEWVKEFADQERCDVVDLIDRALVAYARQVRFAKPAPRR